MTHDSIDGELLAQLLWDFFGPIEPRYFLHDGPNHGIPSASKSEVATYRQCAKDIVASLAFAAAQAGEAGTAETTQIGSVHEHAVGNADAPKNRRPFNHPQDCGGESK
jgi:hypothetical protein